MNTQANTPGHLDAFDSAVALGDTPLSAHEKMAAAALRARLEVARESLIGLGLPLWVMLAAHETLSRHGAELASDPHTVRLRLALAPALPKGV